MGKQSNVAKHAQNKSIKVNDITASIAEYSEGPLPHPNLLAAYDNIIENGAERIMRMSEREQEHRFEADRFNQSQIEKMTSHEIKMANRGQVIAAVLAVLLIGGSVATALLGHGFASVVFLGAGAAMICTSFLGKRKSDDK